MELERYLTRQDKDQLSEIDMLSAYSRLQSGTPLIQVVQQLEAIADANRMSRMDFRRK